MHREWRAYRYDRDDLTTAGKSLWSGLDTSVALTCSGEQYMRGAQGFYIMGMGFHSHQWGSMLHAQDTDVVARYLDRCKERGMNAVSVFSPDGYGGNIASGALAGRPRGSFLSESVGPDVPTSNAYNDLFWNGQAGAGPGAAGALGFDRFFTLLAERGMYACMRFDWPQIHTRYGVSIGSANPKFQGLWWLTGTSGVGGEPDMRSITLTHMLTFVNRVNHLTGKRYGEDKTLAIINSLNEFGIAKFYYVGGSTESFDSLVVQGGASAKFVHAIDAYWVAWHTAAFGEGPRWGAAGSFVTAMPTRFAVTKAGDVNARPALSFNDNWTTSSTTDPQYTQRKRLAQFWEETSGAMHAYFSAQLKAAAPHVLYMAGQGGYVGHAANAAADVIDAHGYALAGPPVNSYNGNSDVYAATFTWSANVVTVVAPAPSEPWQVGQPVRLVKDPAYDLSTINVSRWYAGKSVVSGRFIITNDEKVWKANNTGTTSAIGSGPTGAGPTFVDGGVTWTLIPSEVVAITQVDSTTQFRAATTTNFAGSGVVTASAYGANLWYMHREPAIDTANTLVTTRVNGIDTDVVLAGALKGDNTTFHGGVLNMYTGDLSLENKPATNTELGRRGPMSIPADIYFLDQHINMMLSGFAGAYYFTTYGPDEILWGTEHALVGHSVPWLTAELVTLISRYAGIHPPPTTDLTVASLDDINDWYARHDANGARSGVTPGWQHLVSTWPGSSWAWLINKLRYKIGASSAKTNVSYPNIQGPVYTPTWATNPEDIRVRVSTDTGWMSVETPYFAHVRGRLNGAGHDLDKLWFKPADGLHWYGHVTLVSANGKRLDDPACEMVLMQWALDMAADASFSKLTHDWQMTGDQQMGASEPVSQVQPGVMPRRGLEVKIKTPNNATARRLTNGKFQKVGTRYRDGGAWIRMHDARLYVSASTRVVPLAEWLNYAPAGTTLGLAVSYQFKALDAASYSLASGALPTGLTLSAGGLLSGYCAAAGAFTFTVRATNAAGVVDSPAVTMTIGAVVAAMALDFTVDGTLPSGFTANRATTGTGASAQRCKADGSFEAIADNLPRWDYDRTSHALLGVLNEGSGATNLLLNTDTGSGQGVSVTSGTAYTLSFWAGSGVSVNWSGAATGSVNGLGATTRQRVTITPGSTGTLTFAIVGGAVDHWQFEVGAFPSNYVASGAGQAVRGAEKINYATMAVPAYNPAEGTWYAEYGFGEPSTGQKICCINGTAGNLQLTVNYQGKVTASTSKSGAQNLDSTTPSAPALGQVMRVAYAYDATTGRISAQGGAVQSGAQDNSFTPTTVAVGNSANIGAGLTGLTVRYLRKLVYYPIKRSDADLVALSNGTLAP